MKPKPLRELRCALEQGLSRNHKRFVRSFIRHEKSAVYAKGKVEALSHPCVTLSLVEKKCFPGRKGVG